MRIRPSKPYQGLISAPGVRAIAIMYPVLTAYIFGRYFYFGERKHLGSAVWLWHFDRALIVVLSIACLIWLYNTFLRDLLALSMLWYGGTAAMSYYFATPDELRDRVFWGEFTGTIMFAVLAFFFGLMSVDAVRARGVQKIVEAPEDELDGQR